MHDPRSIQADAMSRNMFGGLPAQPKPNQKKAKAAAPKTKPKAAKAAKPSKTRGPVEANE